MNREKEIEILEILSRDSRLGAEKVAPMVDASVEEVENAIASLEERGVIKRYNLTVDWEKAGIERIVAFIDVKVVPAREVGFEAVAMRIARYPEVKSSWLISGGSDLRLIVEANSLNQLASFVAENIATIDGVTGTDTHFLLRKYKEDYALFEEPDKDSRLVIAP
ncbi:MAG TPA: Lrp/AsnC family transcriptional regulator [Candidatus Melainabacteria bacterium]|nr:Lrp/AsnC family transcriptional regulator [Candidatus Melainabacteria bacterium]